LLKPVVTERIPKCYSQNFILIIVNFVALLCSFRQVVKSLSLFALGVYIAKEVAKIDLDAVTQ